MNSDLRSIFHLLRSSATLRHGQQLHALLLKSGHLSSLFPANSLLHLYSRFSPDPADAHKLFDSMPTKNPFSYNALVDSYLNSDDPSTSLSLFLSNPLKNSYSKTSIVAGLVKCRDLCNARKLFDEMRGEDSVANTVINSLLHGYFKHGRALEAFSLYKSLKSDDLFIVTTVISGCADHGHYRLGKQLHCRIVVCRVEVDSVLGSALLDMYGKSGDLDSACRVLDSMGDFDDFGLSALVTGYCNFGRFVDARRVFDKKKNASVVLWNSMINGYVANDRDDDALDLFVRMRREEGVCADSSTFASVLSGCSISGVVKTVKQIHACGLKHGIVEDVVVMSALIDSYSKSGELEGACKVFDEVHDHDTILLNSMINVYCNCGRMDDARQIFDSISRKSLISWNSMLVGYSQNGCATEALELFAMMHRLNLRLDKVALASAVSASASICALRFGEQIFALTTPVGLASDRIICTSLIDLYCKCGSVGDGQKLFYGTARSDEALWNSMLMGYASNGFGIEVLDLFEAMRKANVAPNEVTFIGVLSGCCHSGLVDEGMEFFYRMKGEYDVEPTVEHYSLAVDLLVRAGRLEEVVRFIDIIPFKADESMLTSILGGCKAHGNEILGRKVAARLIELNPRYSGPYVQLSSVYAAQGEWERAARIRWTMHDRRIKKNPGYSWIDN